MSVAVLLAVPLGVVGTVAVTGPHAFSDDVYFQVAEVALLNTIRPGQLENMIARLVACAMAVLLCSPAAIVRGGRPR